MTLKLLLINGPNLNMLGQRETDTYGMMTLPEIEEACESYAEEFGMDMDSLQSNHEGEIVDAIQSARDHAAGIIINPAAYSHTSVAILDALRAFEGPVIEVHISNIYKREIFRHHSYVSQRADAVIAGLGSDGYFAAVRGMTVLLSKA